MLEKSFHGRNGFIWFFGIVEDRLDPLNAGRIRVRIFGKDTADLNEIPVESLFWAQVMMPCNSASISGVGQSPTGILPGSMVAGFFLDGMDQQRPIILGTIPAIPSDPINNSVGFADPAGVWPKIIGEPDTNRLARNEKIDQTIVQTKNSSLDSFTTASGGSISEPASPYAAKYPFNQVRETESGHVEEFDDTPGAERILRYHKSGSFDEIHPNGSWIRRVVGSLFRVITGNSNKHVKGSEHIAVDGERTIRIGTGLTVKIVQGNYQLNLDSGNFVAAISNNANVQIQGNLSVDVTGNAIVAASQVTLLAATTRCSGNLNVDGKVTAGGDVVGGGISLQNHKHGGITPGAATNLTSPPV